MESVAETKGRDSSNFKKLEKKRIEYITAIEATEEGREELEKKRQFETGGSLAQIETGPSKAEEEETKRHVS